MCENLCDQTSFRDSLRQLLHERGVICNRIVFYAATPSIYTTPIETVGNLRTGQYKMQTADCRLQIGFKMRTSYKMQTADWI